VTAHLPDLVRFEGLRKSFGGQIVLGGVSGEIRPGEIILLRGENGSGKTTLLNILTGCLEPDCGTIVFSSQDEAKAETFSFPRPWYHELNPFQHFTPERVARLGVGRTWQDVRLFHSLDLADNITSASTVPFETPWAALFGSRRNREFSKQNRLAASTRLAALGLEKRDDSSADKISLGQSKRVAIARALQAKARILFLDEPLAGLDADGVHDVLAHLRGLASEHGLTLVIIEHVLNIPRLLDFATTVWTLKSGALAQSKPEIVKEELASNHAAADIHALIRQAFAREVPVTTQTLPQGASLTTYWLTEPQSSAGACPAMEIESLALHRGRLRLFGDTPDSWSALNLRLHHGTVNVLEAPNGWGKTSLMNRIIGFLQQEAGTVTLNGTQMPDIAASPVFHKAGGRALRSEVTLFPTLTVAETAMLAGISPRGADQHRFAGSLSGGESRELGIECLGSANVLLMDEFFQGLDSARSTSLLTHLLSSSSQRTLLFLQPSTFSNS